MSEMEMLLTRIDDLDRRVTALENAQRKRIWNNDGSEKIAEDLTKRYCERVNKTRAAEIIGVTRATVYAMLSDGRLEGACNGKKVTVMSIARYLAAPKTPALTKKGGRPDENPEPVD